MFVMMEKQYCTDLMLLDLSVVFDTIDYQILLDGLNEWFGLGGWSSTWNMASILSKCCPLVPIKLILGVTQGSCFDHSYLLCILLSLIWFCELLSQVKNIKHYNVADTQSTSPWTYKVLKTKLSKPTLFPSKTGCTKTNWSRTLIKRNSY